MQFEIETLNSVQKRVKVTLPDLVVNKALTQTLEKLKQKSNIAGFRPGKAPTHLLKNLYGSKIAVDSVESLLSKSIQQLLRDKDNDLGKLPIIGTPIVEEFKEYPKEGSPFDFSFIIDVKPEVSLNDLHKGLKISVPRFVVKDGDLQKALEATASSKALREAKQGSVDFDNIVHINLSAKDAEGNVYKPLTSSNGTYVSVTKTSGAPKELINMFLGMTVGEKRNSSISIKDATQFPSAPEPISVTAELLGLEQLRIPTIDDEFAKDCSFENMEQMRTAVQQDLERNCENRNRDILGSALLEALAERFEFEIPPSIVDASIDAMIKEANPKASKEQLKEMLANKPLRESFLDSAKRQAKNSIILHEVAQAEKVNVTDEEIRARFNEIAPPESLKQLTPAIIDNYFKSFSPRIHEELFITKAIQTLENLSTIEFTEDRSLFN